MPEFHENRPDLVHFPCPGCGRICELEPKFGTVGIARGTRHGHGVRHSLPTCNTWERLTPQAFMVLAISEVPHLNADPHVSVKQPDAPPLIIADLGAAGVDAAQAAARQQALDVEAAHAEAREIAHRRDQLQADERAMDQALERARRRGRWRDRVLLSFGFVTIAFMVGSAWYLWGPR